MGLSPQISAVVCTRNRPSDLSACVESILGLDTPDFELIVVDQSDDPESLRAIRRFVVDPRLRYIASPTRGLSRARNIGASEARAPIIAFTDDDCRVQPGWLTHLLNAFQSKDAVLAFGTVQLPCEVAECTFGASFAPTSREPRNTFPGVDQPWGVGANMALHRSVFERVGKFDPLLGAGSVYRAGEELDFTIRVLATGLPVHDVPDARVLHLGVRQGADASAILHAYAMGTGAALSKHIRLGTPGARALAASWWSNAARKGLGNLLRGRTPSGLGYLAALTLGMVKPLTEGLDGRANIYVDHAV